MQMHENITVLCAKCRQNFTIPKSDAITQGYDSIKGYACHECTLTDANDTIKVMCNGCHKDITVDKVDAINGGFHPAEGFMCAECKLCTPDNDKEQNVVNGSSSKSNNKLKVEDCSLRELKEKINEIVSKIFPDKWGRFPCPACDKTIKKRKNLRCHMLMHSELKPYACYLCDKKFRLKHTLHRHVLGHTGIKTHECPVCHKLFAGHISRHMATHLSSKTYTCEICNARYTKKEHLMRHLRLHEYEGHESVQEEGTPQPCTICHRMIKRSLHKHMLTHFREHRCRVCNKSFTRPCRLRHHMKLHPECKGAGDDDESILQNGAGTGELYANSETISTEKSDIRNNDYVEDESNAKYSFYIVKVEEEADHSYDCVDAKNEANSYNNVRNEDEISSHRSDDHLIGGNESTEGHGFEALAADNDSTEHGLPSSKDVMTKLVKCEPETPGSPVSDSMTANAVSSMSLPFVSDAVKERVERMFPKSEPTDDDLIDINNYLDMDINDTSQPKKKTNSFDTGMVHLSNASTELEWKEAKVFLNKMKLCKKSSRCVNCHKTLDGGRFNLSFNGSVDMTKRKCSRCAKDTNYEGRTNLSSKKSRVKHKQLEKSNYGR